MYHIDDRITIRYGRKGLPALLETLGTGPLRRYMNARIGNGWINEPFCVANGDFERVIAACPLAVRLFDRIQDVIFA